MPFAFLHSCVAFVVKVYILAFNYRKPFIGMPHVPSFILPATKLFELP